MKSKAKEIETAPKAYGYLVEFETTDALLAAAAKVRDAGYTRWDAHTPFPVHGLDEAMDIAPTKLPWLVLGAGLTGAVSGLLLQWWTNTIDFPFLVSGKPYFSLPANIPVIFEVTVLFSAFGAFLGMLAFNGLPLLYHALFTSDRFRKASSDRFFISIESADPKFSPDKTRAFLDSLGGAAVELVED